MTSEPEEYYRIEDHLVSAGMDEWDNSLGPPRVCVYAHRFRIIKRTPKGVWLNVYGSRRFVLASARKRFACSTLAQARESFVARKRRQISILSRQLEYAKQAMVICRDNDDLS